MQPWVHPETQEGEIFLTNAGHDEDEVKALGRWKSARRGVQAYDILKRPIADARITPIFVSLEEHREHYGTMYG